ncbi:hypothetical protein VT52_022390 [Streptomyces malaysiense]|uniref:Uncharacterized protein n=1 Tax=Streptomyces malaysiense TaxID=1428626 RepID=A0A1J4PZ39_9ACTN|nr:hypothetical protein VT52_022390 [Streptomyces malaysiense]
MLTVAETGGFQVGRRPFAGEVRPAAGTGTETAARVPLGEKRLVVPVREGVPGARGHDPGTEARRASRGIEAAARGPRRVVPGRFTPYEARRVPRLGDTLGRARAFALAR